MQNRVTVGGREQDNHRQLQAMLYKVWMVYWALRSTAHKVPNSAPSAAQAAWEADQASRNGITIIERSTRNINALAN
ncbi:hypothetical protein [Pseudomonas sp. Z1-14]|uniref:hypothetical protein n=1 Tax=Pseudomonas sp. Z1-14 TaxID=2817409 RepID=UPI003DA9DA64